MMRKIWQFFLDEFVCDSYSIYLDNIYKYDRLIAEKDRLIAQKHRRRSLLRHKNFDSLPEGKRFR